MMLILMTVDNVIELSIAILMTVLSMYSIHFLAVSYLIFVFSPKSVDFEGINNRTKIEIRLAEVKGVSAESDFFTIPRANMHL